MQVRFRIVESLKGASDAQTTMTFEPSSEELSYVKGQRVLVYAHRSGGLWSTACTRSKVLLPADTETSALRAFRGGRPGGVIDGNVATAQLLRGNRASGIRVVVQRAADTVEELQTDFAGRFETGWLSPGWYVLSTRDPRVPTEIRYDVVVPQESRCISVGSIR
jgi:hypothetical protein